MMGTDLTPYPTHSPNFFENCLCILPVPWKGWLLGYGNLRVKREAGLPTKVPWMRKMRVLGDHSAKYFKSDKIDWHEASVPWHIGKVEGRCFRNKHTLMERACRWCKKKTRFEQFQARKAKSKSPRRFQRGDCRNLPGLFLFIRIFYGRCFIYFVLLIIWKSWLGIFWQVVGNKFLILSFFLALVCTTCNKAAL